MPETSTEPPRAELVHRIPGRLRLRVLARRGDAAFFAELAERFGTVAGVSAVRANPRTGSILLEHGGDADALLGRLREHAGLEIVAEPPAAARRQQYGRRMAGMPPLSAAAAGLAGLGALQLARGRAIGPASENFWMALRMYADLGRPRVAALLLGLGLFRLARGGALGSAGSLFYYAAQMNRMASRRAGRSAWRE